jgi:hypothetical protein
MGSRQNDDNTLISSVGIVIFIFVSCWLAAAIDSPLLGFFLLWGPALLYVFIKLPIHVTARILVLIGLLLEGPEERPGNGYWVPPFAPANQILLAGMNKWLAIPGASFPLFSVLCIFLLIRARKERKTRLQQPSYESRNAIHLHLAGIGIACIWGLSRGGSGQPMYWQLIYPVTTVIATLALLWSFRGKQDIHALGTTVIVVALTKAILVMWVYFVICHRISNPFMRRRIRIQ